MKKKKGKEKEKEKLKQKKDENFDEDQLIKLIKKNLKSKKNDTAESERTILSGIVVGWAFLSLK